MLRHFCQNESSHILIFGAAEGYITIHWIVTERGTLKYSHTSCIQADPLLWIWVRVFFCLFFWFFFKYLDGGS